MATIIADRWHIRSPLLPRAARPSPPASQTANRAPDRCPAWPPPSRRGTPFHRGKLRNRASDRADAGRFAIEKTIITS